MSGRENGAGPVSDQLLRRSAKGKQVARIAAWIAATRRNSPSLWEGSEQKGSGSFRQGSTGSEAPGGDGASLAHPLSDSLA